MNHGGGVSDGLAGFRLHPGFDEAHVLAPAKQAGMGGHVLADGGGQVVDLDRGGMPGPRLLPHGGAGHALATHRGQGGRAASVQGLAGVGVLVLEGQGDAGGGALFGALHRVQSRAQCPGVGRFIDPFANAFHGALRSAFGCPGCVSPGCL